MLRPVNYSDIEKWVNDKGVEAKIQNHGETVRCLVKEDGSWQEVFWGEYSIDEIILFFISKGIEIGWQTVIKKPESLLDIYEWVYRQEKSCKYLIQEHRDMMSMGLGGVKTFDIYEKQTFRLIKQVAVGYNPAEYYSKLAEAITELGIKADWV